MECRDDGKSSKAVRSGDSRTRLSRLVPYTSSVYKTAGAPAPRIRGAGLGTEEGSFTGSVVASRPHEGLMFGGARSEARRISSRVGAVVHSEPQPRGICLMVSTYPRDHILERDGSRLVLSSLGSSGRIPIASGRNFISLFFTA